MTTEITNGAQFIKQGNNIRVKPGGLDYDLISGKVYDLHWDDWKSTYIFSENGELNLPKKVYELKKDVIFKKRVLKYFEDAPTQTTGIMLAGTKGTGKTVLAKILAKAVVGSAVCSKVSKIDCSSSFSPREFLFSPAILA